MLRPPVGVRISGLVATKPDDELDLTEIEKLLGTVVKGIKSAQNRVRYTMNGFVIAVGTYVKPLLKEAKATARQIGEVSVDVGETACHVPLATAYIERNRSRRTIWQEAKNYPLLGFVPEQLRKILARKCGRGSDKTRSYHFG